VTLVANIGRYEVIRVLGQGGMGRVLLARDSVLGRHVAIKILRDDLGLPPESRDALFARMRQEARAAAAIAHPHIVTLHDMGEEPEVGLYLVFEYVTGPTLRDKIGEGPIDAGIAAMLARHLGDALTIAHDAGVIHRDVKPENVILSPYGAILTDFGIARLGESTLTTAGSVLGTPAYSAPEALALGEFSPATDQFSLAATVFEALSALRAFSGDDALAIASRIATEPTPSFRLSGADPRLVSRLDAILGRALSKDPARRYSSCRAFGEALALAIESRTFDLPVATETPVPRSIVPRATRRVHNLIAAGALLVIVGLILLGRPEREGISLRRVVDGFGAIAGPSRAGANDGTQRHRPHGGVTGGGAGTAPPNPDHTDRAGAHSDAISHETRAVEAGGHLLRDAGGGEPEGLDGASPD
jgi:eukaryotic-like serine/threonine-protein kinase